MRERHCIRQDVEWWAENPCLYFQITPEGADYGFFFWKPRTAVLEEFRRDITERSEEFLALIRSTEAAALKVDAVSGATYSSTAIVRNVQQTLAAYVEAEGRRTDVPAVGWLRTAAVAVVLLLGVLAAWAGRGRKGVRVVVILRIASSRMVG